MVENVGAEMADLGASEGRPLEADFELGREVAARL